MSIDPNAITAILNPGAALGLVAGCCCLVVGWVGGSVWSALWERL